MHTDSLLNLRAYACESQNLKLRYSVNGKYAPADLPLAEKYDFRVSVGYFKEDESTVPVRCDVISDGGATLLTVTDVDFSDFSFSIDSNSARWFYLRFVDSKGRRTWSPPVFTGREYDVYTNDGLIPIDSGEYTLCDKDGCAVPALSDGNVHTNATFDEGACELIFDFGRARSVAALGNYAPLIDIQKLRAEGISPVMPTSSFAVDYEISTSLDGESWEICKTGLFRAFAGEDIVRFAKRDARMVKLKINSTTGKRYGKKPYSDMPLVIAELSLFSEE